MEMNCVQYGATPIIVAIMNGHKEVVQLLLEANADIGELKTPVRVDLCYSCTRGYLFI